MSVSRHGRLAASRQAQAFNALLEEDLSDDDDGSLDARQTSRKAATARERRDRRRGKTPVAVPGFGLHDEALAAERAADVDADAVPALRQMFPAAEPALLAEVSAACGGSLNAAIDALLAMEMEQGPAQLAQPSANPAEGVHRWWAQMVAPLQTMVCNALKAVMQTAGKVVHAAVRDVPGSGWDALPAECKLLIFEQLSNRELARAARTCREFAAHIRGLRASLTSIVLPRGVPHWLRTVSPLLCCSRDSRRCSLGRFEQCSLEYTISPVQLFLMEQGSICSSACEDSQTP